MSLNQAQESRTKDFTRNVVLEAMLKEVNTLLESVEHKIITEYQKPTLPMVFIMGAHRSGTTLFMQWLANTGIVAYPTNLLSRFYQAPIIGAKIQLLLTDPRYNFRDELGEFVQQTQYQSENGKTKGVLAPNEFWYFWRRFLADLERDVWTDQELKQSMNTQTMLAELAGLMDVFHKPFAAKGMLFNYNIPFFDSLFEKVLFVQIKRDIASNVASVLEARQRQLGSATAWYSFKIPEYDMLKNLDPITQATGQVHYINQAVTAGMSKVAEHRKLVVQYEDFCANPRLVFDQIVAKLKLDQEIKDYSGSESFKLTRGNGLQHQSDIYKALEKYSNDNN